MISQILLIIGALIFGVLGLIHLFFTFSSNKFNAYDSDVTVAMKSTFPVITKELRSGELGLVLTQAIV